MKLTSYSSCRGWRNSSPSGPIGASWPWRVETLPLLRLRSRHRDFEHGHGSQAFEELVPLADSGDREAARIAMLMTTQGPRLFGRSFPALPSQRDRWQEAAGRVYAAE